MSKLKNKTVLRIVVFAIIMTMVLWLMPTSLISAEGSGSSLAELQAAADTANAALTDAQAAADTAGANLAGAQTAADAANLALAGVQAAADGANLALTDAQTAADAANIALAAANEGGIAEEISAAQTAADAANLALTDAQAAADAANLALTDAQAAADAANLALTDAQAAADAANAALIDAQAAADAANAALEAALNQDENPPEVQGGGSVILSPALSTDKEDYQPEETVIITGTGFAPNAIYDIKVTRPDGSIVPGDASFIPNCWDTILTDASGNFTYPYILDGILGLYTIRAIDAGGTIVATATFTDCSAWIILNKFWDKNGDSIKNGTDSDLGGAIFKLYKKSGSSWNYVSSDTSESNGDVSFHITSYGTYKAIWGHL
jgi:hypothetical protein